MKEVLLSDWTLAAVMQREEERRRKEQTEAAVVSPRKEMQRSTEPLRSEWTVAALQQRFTALERRIVSLEQIVGEQRGKEQAEAASVAPRDETPARENILLDGPTLVAPKEVDQQARFIEAKIDDVMGVAAGHAGEQRSKRDGAGSAPLDAIGMLEREPIGVAQIASAHKKSHSSISFIVTVLIAGTIGFGAAIYLVPVEKAVQYRTLAKRGLDSIFEGRSASIKQ
jgi:hypothetical protein